jgi:hypothetical protein
MDTLPFLSVSVDKWICMFIKTQKINYQVFIMTHYVI